MPSVGATPNGRRPSERRIVVTGGAGFVGSQLAARLVSESDVAVLDNCSTGRRDDHSTDRHCLPLCGVQGCRYGPPAPAVRGESLGDVRPQPRPPGLDVSVPHPRVHRRRTRVDRRRPPHAPLDRETGRFRLGTRPIVGTGCYSTVTLFARFRGLSIDRPSRLAT